MRGNGIRVHFAALQSALIEEGKEKESQNTNAKVSLENDSFEYMIAKLDNLSDKIKINCFPL